MEDARRKYLHNKIFKAIVPHFVDSKYDHGPFKLIATISGLEIYLWTTLRIWRWSRSLTENGLTQRRFRCFTSPPLPPGGLLLKKPFDWTMRIYPSTIRSFRGSLTSWRRKSRKEQEVSQCPVWRLSCTNPWRTGNSGFMSWYTLASNRPTAGLGPLFDSFYRPLTSSRQFPALKLTCSREQKDGAAKPV